MELACNNLYMFSYGNHCHARFAQLLYTAFFKTNILKYKQLICTALQNFSRVWTIIKVPINRIKNN